MKPSAKRFAVIGAGLCVAAALAFGVLRMRGLREAAPAELASVLSRATGLDARVKDASVVLGSNVLLAHELVLGRAGRQLLTAHELRVQLAGSAWLRGRLEPRTITLRGVSLALDASE